MEHWIPTALGVVFAWDWRPAGAHALPPVILLHDSLGCVALWREFPEALAARTGRRVIAYDRLGFGQSDSFPGPLPLDFIYSECRTVLPALSKLLGLHEFVLFGHSVGGGMSIVGAADLGAHCVALISESAQVFREEITFEGIRAARSSLAPGGSRHERLTKYHGEKTGWVVSSWIENWLNPAFSLDLTAHMPKIRCPVLALHGERDEFGSPDQARFLCEHVAGSAQAHVMSGCGHVPHRERRDDVLELVARFLAENKPP